MKYPEIMKNKIRKNQDRVRKIRRKSKCPEIIRKKLGSSQENIKKQIQTHLRQYFIFTQFLEAKHASTYQRGKPKRPVRNPHTPLLFSRPEHHYFFLCTPLFSVSVNHRAAALILQVILHGRGPLLPIDPRWGVDRAYLPIYLGGQRSHAPSHARKPFAFV